MLYRDRYFAKDLESFGWQETVFQESKPIWIMNYYGFMISNKAKSEEVYGFLRKAMRLVEEARPFRGCSDLEEKDYEYRDESKGDANRFLGAGKIFFKSEEVYRLEYHRGKL